VLRRIFGSRSEEVTGDWKELKMKSFRICTASVEEMINVRRKGNVGDLVICGRTLK
jgi:hypothetical protein